MNDSTDNTNELDSYGVWVKHQPSTGADSEINESAESFDIDDAFDLPDFPESNDTIDAINSEFDIPVEDTLDLSDDFNNETEASDSEGVDSIEETEIDIPAEESIELPEIDTSDFEFPTEESAAPQIEDNFEINIPEESVISEETETVDASSDISDISIDDFNIEETDSAKTDDFQLPTEDGEISLDDFGFDDSSSGSSDDFQLPTEDGEISLDDFGFDDSSSSSSKTEEIVDEKPLDMDISFDASADAVETVDNVESDEIISDNDSSSTQTEEIVDFDTHTTEISSGDTEEIDLSDFGIDADAEETPITQNVEESKLKDRVVDYDLSVSDDNMASAPVVNEIKESQTNESSSDESVVPEVPVNANVTAVNNDLLEQIVADLSGLKEEINNLKTNLEEIKAQEHNRAQDEPVIPETTDEDAGGFFDDTDGDDTIALSGNELDNIMNTVEFSEETVVEENNEPVFDDSITEESNESIFDDTIVEENEEPVFEETAVSDSEINIPESDEGGFFDNIDGDDTIALSGNELDNIMNNVEFSEAEMPSETVTEETETVDSDEPAFETFEDDEEIPQEIDIEPVKIEPDFDLSDDIEEEKEEELTFDESSVKDETSSLTSETDIFGSVSEDEFIAEETDNFEETEFESESDEVLEEPNLDNIVLDDIANEDENEELPDEISIPKVDDILVESSNDDFINSVQDNTPQDMFIEEASPEAAEEISEEFEDSSEIEIGEKIDDYEDFMQMEKPTAEALTEGNINYLSEEKPEETDDFSDASFPSVENFLNPDPIVNDDVLNEPVFEETAVDEPVIEDEIAKEPVVETAPESEPIAESEPENTNDDLKQDIKSVLLYMDQLLENLPEEKIVEFAKSDEFATYKKLFSELGLS